MNSKNTKSYVLDNGIRVVVQFENTPVSHLGVMVMAGSRYEKPGEEGLAHFLEHCIFKGTNKRRAYHVLSRLDAVGGELNAYTTKEEIAIYASFSKEYFSRSSELLADICFNSNFPKNEIEKEKAIILDEINAYLDSPSDKIFDDFEAYLFKNHPLGNNILGTPESVKSFTDKDLTNYIERFFFPENIVISIVGNHNEKRLLKRLNKDFGSVNLKGIKKSPKMVEQQSVFKMHTKESNYQTHIMVGGEAPGVDSDNRRVMTLLINMLGGPALNSRLALSIREKHGFSYNIEANYTPYQETGYWNVYASTDQENSKKTLHLIWKELKRFQKEKLTEYQLSKAKTQLKGHLALAMDSNSGIMLNNAKSLLVFNQLDTLEEIHDKIDKISAESIQELAQKYFIKENCSELVFTPR